MAKEASIVKSILTELKTRGSRVFAFKNHGSRFSTAGIPDLIVTFNRTAGPVYDGVLRPTGGPAISVFLEVKVLGAKPTEIQKHTHDTIRAAGGLVFVVHSKNEALAVLEHWGLPPALVAK